MSTSREYDNPGRYEIVVRGRLDPMWLDWFDGFSGERRPNMARAAGPPCLAGLPER